MRDYAISKETRIDTILDYDVVIVGSGVAGLYAAINLDKSLKCAIINKSGLDESNSIYAQGGIATVRLDDDSFDNHYNDTLKAGAGLCDEQAVRVLIEEGPQDIERLVDLGVPFDKDSSDHIAISKEGAHSHNRIIHCGGDATGYHLVKTLVDKVNNLKNVTIYNNMSLLDIIVDDNEEVNGLITQDINGMNYAFNSSKIVLASGGVGRIFRNSTNFNSATGDGIACAMRAGVEVDNMEFVQFHPTALIHPDNNMRFFLISEALRGEGALLRNRRGEAFMENVHPMADLAPRDIVSRAIVNEMKKNDLPNVYLDITFKQRGFLEKRFPKIYETCMKRSIDIAVNWIPVVPVQHYFMGGIKTDLESRTSLKGLYACGECANSGVHGANRLASNSLLECLVFGRRAARDINNSILSNQSVFQLPVLDIKCSKTYDTQTYRSQIRNYMTKNGGIIRSKYSLEKAITDIQTYYDNLSKATLSESKDVETLNMSTVALSILKSAINRQESVGAHYREDTAREE